MRGASRQLKKIACFVFLSFAGLVALAKRLNPIPSRTRPLNASAPMVLWLKPWESRSLPGLPRTRNSPPSMLEYENAASFTGGGVFRLCAAFICLHQGQASLASFGHDPRSAWRASELPEAGAPPHPLSALSLS